jgi:hypothetical protein
LAGRNVLPTSKQIFLDRIEGFEEEVLMEVIEEGHKNYFISISV